MFAFFVNPMPLLTFPLVLEKKEFLTKDIIELYFEKPATLSFVAGQFLQFMIPVAGGTTVPRSYSMASAPDDTQLRFCVKILPEGKASQHFAAMAVGDKVAVRGPLGHFTHPHPGAIDAIATGAGITPIMSIIRDELIYKQSDFPIHLIFGVRHQQDIFWQQELQDLSIQYPTFTYTLTLSQGATDSSWQGATGRVTTHMPATTVGKDFYLCGSTEMVKDTRALLLAKGVDGKKIHLEIF